MARTTRRKNRKKQADGVAIHAPTIAVVTVLATVFISYLYLCGQCDELGMRIKKLEQDKEQLHRRVQVEESKWSRMKSPGQIPKYLQRHGLDMTWPDESRILRIPIRVVQAFQEEAPEATVQFAARTEPERRD